MTNPAKLLALADRVEKATGPDSEIDRAIVEALALIPAPVEDHAQIPLPYAASIDLRYTASLDAAMTLVPEDHRCSIDNYIGNYWWAFVAPQDADEAEPAYVGDTPALALCAAALRARAAMGAQDRTEGGAA